MQYKQSGTTTLIDGLTPSPLEESQTMHENTPPTYFQSTRNSRNLYQVGIDKSSVFLNYIASKTQILDSALSKLYDNTFQYFTTPEQPTPDILTYPSGMIFRCAGQGVKSSIELYTYYLVQDGQAVRIPNWRTVEVLMAERNITSGQIRVLESDECDNMVFSSEDLSDQSSQWSPIMEDVSSMEKLAEINAAAEGAEEIAAQAQQSMQQQVDAVLAQAAADKAEAEAAEAEAKAAEAASAAAIANASAAQAQAAAAQAAAEAAKAEADLAKAEFEANNPSE